MSAEIAASPLRVTRRDSLFADTYNRGPSSVNWDVFPGGNEFLMVRQPKSASHSAFVVLNWPEMRSAQQAAAPPERP